MEKIVVASALVARIPADIRLFNLFPGYTRGQAVISGSGCAVLGAAGLYAFAADRRYRIHDAADELVRIPRRAEISRCAR